MESRNISLHIQKKMLSLLYVIGFIVLSAVTPMAHAELLYDETTSGDAGDESNPLELGLLVSGAYTIRGSLCFSGDCGAFDPGDAYCFKVASGSQITSGEVALTNVVGVGGAVRVREWDDTCNLTGTAEWLGDISEGTHSLLQVPYEGGTSYGPGMFFGDGTEGGDAYDYEWTFVIEEHSKSIPTLNGQGITMLVALLMGFAYYRRRKAAT